MSSDWRGSQGESSAYPQQSHGESASPFMRTAFGYSTPNQESPSSAQVNSQVGYQQEIKSTPTSVLLPFTQDQNQVRGKLSTIKGEQAGDSWFLNRSHTSLGRALDNDIVLLDIAASRKHAQVIRGELGFSLLDLRSANGIFLNGRRVTEEELYDGDEIEIGETILRFESLGESRHREILDDDTSPGVEPILHTPSPPMSQRQGMPYPGHIPLPPLSKPKKEPLNSIPITTPVISRSASKVSNKQQHITYGFGSQWSQEDLGVSPQQPQLQRSRESKSKRINEFFYKTKFDIRVGRGRKATILRMSLALTVLLIFFAVGGMIHKLTASLIDETPSDPTTVSTSKNMGGLPDPLVTAIPTAEQGTQLDENSIRIDRATELLARRQWREVIKVLQDQSFESTSLNDPRLDALLSQAEQSLIEEKVPALLKSIERGVLKSVESTFKQLNDSLSTRAQGQLIPIAFSLWLHRRELGNLSKYNPPRREQKVLETSAQLSAQGKYRRALGALKKRRPHRSRLALFTLRKASLNTLLKDRSQRLKIKDLELQHLLGNPFDVQELLQQYRARIEQGVRKTQYKEVAPWLEAAILLSVDQPQIHQYFKGTQIKLKAEAVKWLNIAIAEGKKRNNDLARALLDAAIPYLSNDDLKNAKRLMKKMKRR